jgi:hypothetical protein
MWLQGQTDIHHDLPSRDWSRAEDQEDYVQFDAYSASRTGRSTGDSAQAVRQLRIIRTCA